MIYLLIHLTLLLAAVFLSRSPRASWYAYTISIILLILFVAFRFEVGCDWTGYLNQFNVEGLRLSLGIEIERREPLWWLLLTIQHKLGLPYPWINIAAALGFFAGIHAFARKQSDPMSFLALSFPVLVMNLGITQIRQGVAVGIICLAFLAFQQRRLVTFGALTLLAAGFHSSALIFLLFIPFIPGHISRRNLLIAGLLAVPGLFFLITSDAGDVAFQRYIVRDVDAAGAIFRAMLLVATGIFFFVFLRARWKVHFPDDYKLVYLGAGLMFALVPLVLVSSVIGDRFGYYLIPIQCAILCRLPYLMPRGRIILGGTYAVLTIFFLVWINYSPHFQQCYLPYQSWIFETPTSSRYIYT